MEAQRRKGKDSQLLVAELRRLDTQAPVSPSQSSGSHGHWLSPLSLWEGDHLVSRATWVTLSQSLVAFSFFKWTRKEREQDLSRIP